MGLFNNSIQFFKNIFSGSKKNVSKIRSLKPVVYDNTSHHITRAMIDICALKVVRRLKKFGFSGYIVGGAVRDLLMGKKPKDFDVVTDATPKQIKRIFANAKIIGKRFRLVHILFREEIIEAATFRSTIEREDDDEELLIKRDNVYGTMEEDVIRRDFGINALYFEPFEEKIIDYVDGFKDIKDRRLRTLRDEEVSFLEDPVRMIRAVKYSQMLGFTICKKADKMIIKLSHEIQKTSKSRLYEELKKIILSGKSLYIFLSLHQHKILRYMASFLDEEFGNKHNHKFVERLASYDAILMEKPEFDFDLFWGIALYSKMEKEFKIPDECNIQDLQRFFAENLLPLQVPKRKCEKISYIYYHYFQVIKNDGELKRKLKDFAYNQILYMLMVFQLDKEIYRTYRRTMKHIRYKKRPARRPYRKQRSSSKSIQTEVSKKSDDESDS